MICDGCTHEENCPAKAEYGGAKRCSAFKPQEMTNEEWRKTCYAEEFAEFLSNLAYSCMRCGMSNGEAYCHTGYCIQDKADAEKWLKEIHK